MSRKATSISVLRKVVKNRGEVFTTKDVSEDLRVMKAHRKLVKHSHYYAFIEVGNSLKLKAESV